MKLSSNLWRFYIYDVLRIGWEVTLMESMNKRCVFLEHVIGHVGLPNVQVVRGRAEVMFLSLSLLFVVFIRS